VELALGAWDVPALAAAWRTAQPFPHVVIDGMMSEAAVVALRDALAREPHAVERSEIVDCYASAAELVDPELAAFAASLRAPAVLDAVHAITGKRVRTVEVRCYCYVTGGYLLPHTDGMHSIGRKIAFAAYLSGDGQCEGGDLELFRCELDAGGDIAAAEPAMTIEHRCNRLVLFDVSDVSLHQIREVTAGSRVSLAGWFL
jgi:Rps23 Pro-64 3,4-dihydroxylase Tpa1-like proline 4-hydroxylase